MDQLTIDAIETPGVKKTATQIEREWLADNPEAFEALVWFTAQDVRRGVRPSIGFYAELLRRPDMWPAAVRDIMGSRYVQRPEGHVYVINNTIRALLARRIEREHFGSVDVFEKRRSKHDGLIAVNASPQPGGGGAASVSA